MGDLFSHLDPAASPKAGSGMAAQRGAGVGQAAMAAPVAAAARPEGGANPVRLVVDNSRPAPTERRDVLFFYVEGWPPPGAPRWEWRMNVEPVEALARVLKWLQRRPEHVAIEMLRLGDLGVISAGPGEPRRPLCMIPPGDGYGLDFAEARTALTLLTPKTLERRA